MTIGELAEEGFLRCDVYSASGYARGCANVLTEQMLLDVYGEGLRWLAEQESLHLGHS